MTPSSEITEALASIAPALRVMVQTYDTLPPDTQIAGSYRPVGQRRRQPTSQLVEDAAVYIVQPDPTPLLSLNGYTLHELLVEELRTHLNIFRANPFALMLLAPPLLPEPGSVPLHMEVQARVRDFAQIQLSNESAFEVSELIGLVNGFGDSHGKFVVTEQLRSVEGATVALAVSYSPNVDGLS